jgi:hypothetical protein
MANLLVALSISQNTNLGPLQTHEGAALYKEFFYPEVVHFSFEYFIS